MKRFKGLIFVIVAALLLEVLSGVQYYYTHGMLENELEHRAESELFMKAIIIKAMLNKTQSILDNNTSDVMRNINRPDSMFGVVENVLASNSWVVDSWVAFRPYFYSGKGRLFEPTACINGDSVVTFQAAGPNHDYTEKELYTEAVKKDDYHWTNPYFDKDGAKELVTTCSRALRDSRDSVMCVMGVDISLEWLGDTLNFRHIYPSSFLILLTEDGEIIADSDNTHDCPQVVELINDSSAVRTPSISGRSDIKQFKSRISGKKGEVFFANMKGSPHWQLAVVCYDNEAYAGLNKLRNYMLLLNLLIVALLVVIVLRYVRGQIKLNRARHEQALTQSELRIAGAIQRDMLPELAAISEPAVDVAGVLEPAKQVGGDLYHYFVRNDKLFFCIGDVSGKGVPSALIMATTKAIFQYAAMRESNPARIMHDYNLIGCRGNKNNMFVTLFIGVLDLPTGRLRYCNAGHDRPLLIGETVQELAADANLPIGVMEDTLYQQQSVTLAPGTTLLLFTDGLTEAMDGEHRLYGLERVKQVAATAGNGRSAQALLAGIAQAVHEFVGEAEQSDDLTMLAIRYLGKDNRCNYLNKTLTIVNDLQEVPRLNAFVDSVSERLRLDKSLAGSVKLAVEEAVVNVINYAYPAGVQGDIRITARSNGSILQFAIIDEGKEFDPTDTAPPDVTLSAEERSIGGLGILLVQQIMDVVNYERCDGCNILTLNKTITNK